MTLNDFYTILGGAITWGVIGGLSGYVLCWICVIVYGGYLKVRRTNFVAFYVFKDKTGTTEIREIYRLARNKMDFKQFNALNKKYGRYAAKYRLRNIKAERFAWI